MTFHDLSPTKFICRFSRFASSLSKAMMALARAVNLLATKNASKDILNVLTKVHFVQFATFQPFYVNFKTVAKIIFFIYPTLRCIGGLPSMSRNG